MVSTYLTGDMTSGMIWSVVAGATANYVYYWHCREHIAAIKQQAWNDQGKQHLAMKESGGVQTYVIWVGVVFYVLFSFTMFKMIQEGALDTDKIPAKPARPVGQAVETHSYRPLIVRAASSSTPETSSNPAHMPRRPSRPTPAVVPIGCRCAASFSATNS
jgi:hypothetical protein